MSEQLVKRLRELSNAVTRADWNEFSMRIPAEKDRDADFVLLQAANKIAALEADAARMKLVVAAAHNWSADRVIDDCDEAELMKAIWRFDGDRTEPCEGCDGQCGEPCAPTTVNAAIAEIDRWIARKSAAMQAKP